MTHVIGKTIQHRDLDLTTSILCYVTGDWFRSEDGQDESPLSTDKDLTACARKLAGFFYSSFSKSLFHFCNWFTSMNLKEKSALVIKIFLLVVQNWPAFKKSNIVLMMGLFRSLGCKDESEWKDCSGHRRGSCNL